MAQGAESTKMPSEIEPVPARRPWHAPEFSVADVGMTDMVASTVTNDGTTNKS
jgi:hypothetical protein